MLVRKYPLTLQPEVECLNVSLGLSFSQMRIKKLYLALMCLVTKYSMTLSALSFFCKVKVFLSHTKSVAWYSNHGRLVLVNILWFNVIQGCTNLAISLTLKNCIRLNIAILGLILFKKIAKCSKYNILLTQTFLSSMGYTKCLSTILYSILYLTKICKTSLYIIVLGLEFDLRAKALGNS